MIKQQWRCFFRWVFIVYLAPSPLMAASSSIGIGASHAVSVEQAATNNTLPLVRDSVRLDVQQQHDQYHIIRRRIDKITARVKQIVSELEIFQGFIQKRQDDRHQVTLQPTKIPAAPRLIQPVAFQPMEAQSIKAESVESYSIELPNRKEDALVHGLLQERHTLLASIQDAQHQTLAELWKIALMVIAVVWIFRAWCFERVASLLTHRRLLYSTQDTHKGSHTADNPVKKIVTGSVIEFDVFSKNTLEYINPKAIEVEEVDMDTYSKWQCIWQDALPNA